MTMNSASSLLFSEYSAVDWCVFLVFHMSVRTSWCNHKDKINCLLAFSLT